MFEVPDGVDYADVAARMIAHQAFAGEQKMKHWSFDLEMRPVAVFQVDVDPELEEVVADARHELDNDHPWIPGAIFRRGDRGGRLKAALLAFLDTLTA
jgi:hypothetical protein